MIKVGNLLDLSFDLEPSTYRSHGLPQSTRTVHHHPEHCQATVHNYACSIPAPGTINVKTEPVWKDEKCPNVEIRNGVLCAVERNAVKPENRDYSRGMMASSRGRRASDENEARKYVLNKEHGTSMQSGSHSVSSPSMGYSFASYHSRLQKKQLFLSKKLLELKRVARKNNYKMSIDLDSLLSQEMTGNTPSSPFDPSSATGMLNLSELSAGSSLYGNDVGIGFDGTLQDLTGCDDPYFMESLYSDGREKFEKLSFDYQVQTPTSDFGSQDSWITTPVSLPPTPEGTAPNSPAMFLPGPSATPTPMMLPYHSSKIQVSSVHHPLTPDSLMSPCSEDQNEEDMHLKEILSFLQEPEPPVVTTTCDHFNSFQLPLSSCDQQSATDDCSSVYSSLLSTPQSPLSPNMHFSQDNFPQSFSRTDTIQSLLTRSHAQPSSTSNVMSPLSSEEIHTPSTSNAADSSSSRKRAPSQAPPLQKRKRVSPSTRKERKREQNKTAAIRYRQKKKDENGEIDERYDVLEEKNMLLKNTLSSLEAEVSYLRKLWDEVERAKASRSQQQ